MEASGKEALERQTLKKKIDSLHHVFWGWLDTYPFSEWLFSVKHDGK